LFATAVLFSNDIYKPLMEKKHILKNSKHLLYVTRIFVVIVGILAILVGLSSDRIYDLTIFAFTLQFGVLFFPFIFALKSKSVNTYGIIAGMLGGLTVNLTGVILEKSIIPEPWEFYTLVPAIVNLLLILIVSYITRQKNQGVPLEKLYL